MNKPDIELPPLPSGLELGNIGISAPDGVGRAMQDYARAAIEPYKQRISELEAQLEAVGAGGVSSQPITGDIKPSIDHDWANEDPAIAFHLIDRYAENWNDAGAMMQA